ncbi:DUF7344 domain-containing protein [Halocatena pleomorpha]|uniref:DUF7344 domain-containing protein n=1 Tax=Halocatena pleomorpha TaxID=1785090 RepID=A0A3P3RLF7_9EURY|nr:helix-turn-helix transcriptional regulator [Halocatena pleomorpha]RRJ33659.1 hypothetical protein EIK79_02360 [Halocatena pleomorpha]
MSKDQDEEDSEPLSQDLVFDLLSSPRRRFVLHYLRSESDSLALTALADEVAAWEYETPVEELSDQERKRAYVSLYQTHIPKLADAGIVEYDTDSGEVTLAQAAGVVDAYLPDEAGPEIPWEFVYPLLTIVCVVLFVIGLIDIGPFSATVAGVLILLLFGITSFVHLLWVRHDNQQLPIDVTENE